jgi:hypothetical protein
MMREAFPIDNTEWPNSVAADSISVPWTSDSCLSLYELPLDHRVVGPLEQGLPLDRAACNISLTTIGFYLARMACEGFPTFDLDDVQFGDAATLVVTAIPLEPSSFIWIL